jgi:ribosomal protein S18 acetylase RimI-like enzyme
MTIRQAALSDVDALAPLFDAYRMFFAGKTDERTRDFLRERISQNEAVILMSFDGTPATGFITLYPLYSSWYATTIWFLSDLYVHEDYREKKIGRQLVAAVQGFAKERGSRSIMVEIPHREPHLVKFYESLGYQIDKDFNLYRYYLT